MMVDAALYAVREIMEDYPEAVLYGQDVGKRLGGVFRKRLHLPINSAIIVYSIQLYRKHILLVLQSECQRLD